MDIAECLRTVRDSLKRGDFESEAAVTQGAVMRVLAALGWDAFDTQCVVPQYPVEGGRVDLALCCRPRKPLVFVEVKQAGREKGADKQLFRYAFDLGVQMVVLSNGQEWSFYLPGEPGHYDDRRVCKLDLLEREIEELAEVLTRYLSFAVVRSGDALKNARKDYESVSRAREVERHLPIAWRQLIEQQDSLLVDLIAEQVEDLCGYRPDPDAVARFLASQLSPVTRRPPPPPPPPPGGYSFTLRGKRSDAQSAIDVLSKVLEQLSHSDPEFLARFASRPKHGRTRRFVAKVKEDLYPNKPDLILNYSHQLSSGWWMGTNYSKVQIEKILQMAAEVAGLTYGKDLVVRLG